MVENMKTLITKITLLFLFPFLFLGCGDESFNTVKYYKAHPKERDARIIECKNALKLTAIQQQDCQNANTASRVPAKDIDLSRHYGEGW